MNKSSKTMCVAFSVSEPNLSGAVVCPWKHVGQCPDAVHFLVSSNKIWDAKDRFVYAYFGLVASDALVQRVPATPGSPRRSSRDINMTAKVNRDSFSFTQNASVPSGTGCSTFMVLLSPARYGGSHVLRRLVLCKAHAIIVVPGTKAYRFPPDVQQTAVQSQDVAKTG